MSRLFTLLTLCSLCVILTSCAGNSADEATDDILREAFFFPTQEAPLDLQIDPALQIDTLPSSEGEGWFQTSKGRNRMYLSIEDDTLIASERSPHVVSEEASAPDELSTTKGKFVGTNYGEFGGTVDFVPNTGKSYTLINDNFIGFYAIGERLFVLTGLAHTSNNGTIYELKFSSGKWKAILLTELESCPTAYLVIEDTLYLATDKGIMLANHTDESIAVYGSRSFWAGQVPISTSIVCANESIYVGMRGGVYAVNTEDLTETWYILSAKENLT